MWALVVANATSWFPLVGSSRNLGLALSPLTNDSEIQSGGKAVKSFIHSFRLFVLLYVATLEGRQGIIHHAQLDARTHAPLLT